MNEFKEKISKYNGDFVFLIGNGINKFMNGAVSWNELLRCLICNKELQLPESLKAVLDGSESKTYLTFPEIFSLANIEWQKQKSRKEKKNVSRETKKITKSSKKLLKKDFQAKKSMV